MVVKSDVLLFLQNKHGKYNVYFADPLMIDQHFI